MAEEKSVIETGRHSNRALIITGDITAGKELAELQNHLQKKYVSSYRIVTIPVRYNNPRTSSLWAIERLWEEMSSQPGRAGVIITKYPQGVQMVQPPTIFTAYGHNIEEAVESAREYHANMLAIKTGRKENKKIVDAWLGARKTMKDSDYISDLWQLKMQMFGGGR